MMIAFSDMVVSVLIPLSHTIQTTAGLRRFMQKQGIWVVTVSKKVMQGMRPRERYTSTHTHTHTHTHTGNTKHNVSQRKVPDIPP